MVADRDMTTDDANNPKMGLVQLELFGPAEGSASGPSLSGESASGESENCKMLENPSIEFLYPNNNWVEMFASVNN